MIATSKARGFAIKVCTHCGGIPTSGWKTNGTAFWRSLGELEGLYENAMKVVPLEVWEIKPNDWEIKP